MKHILALGTLVVCGSFVVAACTASDTKKDPDTTYNSGGNGGNGGNGGSGGSSTTDGSTDAGGTYSTGGSGGDYTAGAAGEAGSSSTSAGGSSTTTTSTTGEGGGAGEPFDCNGDEAVTDLPSCDDLPYSGETCALFDPPEPLGMSLCKEWAANATPEAFEGLFNCLKDISAADPCSNNDTEHDDAARVCRNEVAGLACRNTEATTRCANMGCDEVDTTADGECDVFLSSMTADGMQHIVDCTNDGVGDVTGGTWGTPPEPPTGEDPTCGQVFRACVDGLLQPD